MCPPALKEFDYHFLSPDVAKGKNNSSTEYWHRRIKVVNWKFSQHR